MKEDEYANATMLAISTSRKIVPRAINVSDRSFPALKALLIGL